MYAVVSSGGKQYRVEPGTELTVERVSGDAGSVITFDRVLLVGDGEAVTVGTPTVEGATVSGTVLGEARGPKLIVFKFKQKVKYRRKTGHRQHLTRVRIDEISAGGKTATSTTEAKAEPKSKAKAEPKPRSKSDVAAAAASVPAEEKPKRARRSTAKASDTKASEEADTPKTTRRRSTAKKAEPKGEAEE